jgi:DNA polymerase-1
LAERIATAFGHQVNPDSVTELRDAFRRAGFPIQSTRAWVVHQIDHPAVPDVLAYKELSRLHAANGWAWLAEWVTGGRFRAEYLPGGVVSGRWATRGGGALQIPRAVRSAVMAEPGHRLVVADAAQLEPRVLAALSGDPALAAAAVAGDLYQGVAADGFGGDRAHAKVALLGAMYGATTGESGRLLSVLFDRYPRAMAVVEDAARAGERGESVRSVLGRASPPPGARWRDAMLAAGRPEADDADQRRARQVARDWGRFTRNFVIQASAADWAAVWLSGLRRSLRDRAGAELVFFQHDEVIVHAPEAAAGEVAELAAAAAAEARDLVFPGSTVPTPVQVAVVASYADAK